MSAAKQARVVSSASKAAEQLPMGNPALSSIDNSYATLPAARTEDSAPEGAVVEGDFVKQEPKEEQKATVLPPGFDVPIPSLEQDDHQQLKQQQSEEQQKDAPSSTHDMFTSGMHDFGYAHQDFSSLFGTPIATPTYC